MKNLFENIGIVFMLFGVAFGSFMAGRAYQQDIEKGYYEELQKIKKEWKPKNMVLAIQDDPNNSIMTVFTIPIKQENIWCKIVNKEIVFVVTFN